MKIGSLLISIWYEGDEVVQGAVRRRYDYRVADLDAVGVEPFRAQDLLSAVGAEVDVLEAMRSLISFLSAAGEAYEHGLRHPELMTENRFLFPEWLAEAAYREADGMALLDIQDGDPGVERADAILPPNHQFGMESLQARRPTNLSRSPTRTDRTL